MGNGLIWVGRAIGTITGALSLVKLANHFLEIGLGGVPGFVVASYSEFVADIRYWLLEVPFDLMPPEWVMHGAIIWSLFVGSNLRFLTYENHGQNLFVGFGDVGYGRREPLTGWALRVLNVSVALTGPFFSVFVLVMWLANRKGGPTGVMHWGDRFMIHNRLYSVIISRRYLLVLLLAPISAGLFLAWGAAESLPRTRAVARVAAPDTSVQRAVPRAAAEPGR